MVLKLDWRSRDFLSGLVARAIVVLLIMLIARQGWSLSQLGLSPLRPPDLGSILGAPSPAWPGGWPLMIALSPGALLDRLAGTPAVGPLLNLLAWDVVCYQLFLNVGPIERRGETARLYWWSPAVILLVYAGGSPATVVLAMLLGGFFCLEHGRLRACGVLFGLAAAMAPILLTLAPLQVLAAATVSRVRGGGRAILAGFGLSVLATTLPFILREDYRDAVLGPAVRSLFGLTWPLGGGALSVLPVALVGLYYAAWRARLVDSELLWTFVSLCLLALVALGGPPGGIVVVLTLAILARHSAYSETSGRVLLGALSVAVLARAALELPNMAPIGGWTLLTLGLSQSNVRLLGVVAQTAIAAIALVTGVQALHRGVFRSMTYRASRRPVAIGVAGDSGVGKDTLVDSIADLFSPQAVATVSGDDYHLWDRNKPMWRALTHLNPRANDLASFEAHAINLIDRRWVRARHYDHSTGRMTKPRLIQPGEMVLASGLHALTSPALNALYDLRIYVDMDEDLRRFFKIRRDVSVRGHPLPRVLAALDRRTSDSEAFIRPQLQRADLIMRLEPRLPEQLDLTRTDPIALRLQVEALPGSVSNALLRTLVALSGVHVVEHPSGRLGTRLTFEGEPLAADIAVAARHVAPAVSSLLRAAPAWREGLSGVIQLIMLDQMEQIWRRRSVHA